MRPRLRADVRSSPDHRVLADAAADRPGALSEEERRVYEPEIAFIRCAADSAEQRFQRLRAARVTLLGSGPVPAALLEAGLRSGWRRVVVRAGGDDLAGLRAVARAATRDSAQEVAFDAELALAGTDLLLCVSDRREDLIAAARACARSGVATGQVLVGRDEVWVTEVGPADRVAADSCWRRLDARRGGEGLLTGSACGVIASRLALSCFTHLTGVSGDAGEPVVTRIDLRDLRAHGHRPRPYLVSGDIRPRAEVDVAAFAERIGRYVDERVGVLRRLTGDGLPQAPLAVCRASVSDPESALPAGTPAPVVTGWGGDRDEARWRAALAGLATYASLVDPGGERVDLLTGHTCAVTAVDARSPYHAPVGVAAGRSWGDAVAAGLRAHCEALVAGRVETGRPCDLATAVREVGDERAGELLRLLWAEGVDVGVVDLGGVLGVPAFSLRVAGATITACATTAAEALRDAVERAVLHWQCGLPVDVTRWVAEPGRSEPADDPRCHALVAALRRAGRTLVAVPLVVDDDVRDLAPCLVRVEVGGD
ncbi:hypothetical protein [Saccharothrix sp. HUAS TT1]|uniref:hypothetical protein n=1 Tax=unclassified Saccharothrix TaxID=2593673 RepID=UPI00345C20B1